MKPDKRLIKIAFYGLPGVGKSTSSSIITAKALRLNWWVRRIRFADPLYQAQEIIYRLAGRPLANIDIQDGRLLNFLGKHFRTINEHSLTECFAACEAVILNEYASNDAAISLFLNDDMRGTETKFLRARGYMLTKIVGDATQCLARRRSRGDLPLGAANDSTENSIDEIVPDAEIRNSGTLADLVIEVDNLLHKVSA